MSVWEIAIILAFKIINKAGCNVGYYVSKTVRILEALCQIPTLQ